MKVVVLDDVANLGFNYVKGLRKAGVKADLLVRKGYPFLPEKHRWIKYYDNSNPFSKFISIWRLTRKYDLIHTQGGIAVYAQFMGKPYVGHPMGSDLRLVAGKNTLKDILTGKIYLQQEWSLLENLKNILTGFLLRRAWRNANTVFHSQCDAEYVKSAEKIGVWGKIENKRGFSSFVEENKSKKHLVLSG